MYQSGSIPFPGMGGGPSLELARRQLEQDVAAFGPEHPATMISRHNYAEALSDTDPQAAERLHRQVLAHKERVHGASSVATGTTLNSLGCLLHKRGELAEAETLLRRALAIREAHSAEWRDAGITRDGLACVLQAAGRTAEAREVRTKAGSHAVICSNPSCSKTAAEAGAPLKACTRCRAIWYSAGRASGPTGRRATRRCAERSRSDARRGLPGCSGSYELTSNTRCIV